MKRIWLCLVFMLPAASMTRPERQRLIAHLEMTGSWLNDEVSRLTPAQLNYRTAPGTWSVLDVIEHLTIAEPIYWQQFKDIVKAAPNKHDGGVSDADVLWYGIDRTQHQKTEARKYPKEKGQDAKALISAFLKLHGEMLEYVRHTEEDPRMHFLEKEGTDGYQWLLMISTHAQRHILQIREVKADPKFPV